MTGAASSEYFIAKAEQCFRRARHIRADRSGPDVAAELDAIANKLLARAVEHGSGRDRAAPRK